MCSCDYLLSNARSQSYMGGSVINERKVARVCAPASEGGSHQVLPLCSSVDACSLCSSAIIGLRWLRRTKGWWCVKLPEL